MKFKRSLTLFIIFGLIFLSFSSGIILASSGFINLDNTKEIISTDNPDEASWTCMFYIAGDTTVNTPKENNIPYDKTLMLNIMNQMELSGSTSEVNIVVQADDYIIWEGGKLGRTRRYLIKHDENLDKLANYTLNETVWYLEEQNMGDPSTLNDFISWATSNYPADHYILILCGHGAGWVGICPDYTSGVFNPNAVLNLPEIESALSSCPPLDILLLFACQMGQIEVFYELKEYTNITLAVESIMCNPPQVIEIPLKKLTSNPKLTSQELAQLFIDNYKPELCYNSTGWSPLFGVQSKDIDNITRAVDNFAEEIIKQYKSAPIRTRLMLRHAFKHSTIFIKGENINNIDSHSHELYKVAEKICELSKNKNPKLFDVALNVLSAIDNSSILKPSEPFNEYYHGLAIFSPPAAKTIGIIKHLINVFTIKILTKNYKYKTIDFAEDTQWDEFLKLYYFWSY